MMQISEVAIHKKSWKRCAAHVHISQLIRRLKGTKEHVAKEPDLYEGNQIRVNQGSKSRVLMEAQNSNGTRNRNSSADGTVSSTSFWRFPETKNGIPPHKCHYIDISQSQAPPTPGVYGPQKQVSLRVRSDNVPPLSRSFSSSDNYYSNFAEFPILVLVSWR